MADDDNDWTTIRRELSDPRWDFRTVDGISAATGLAPDRVARLLDDHAGEVRKSYLLDKQGRLLYTLAARSVKFQEILANTFAFITKSVS